MSGIVSKQRRKRRKTRAERNMSRHGVQTSPENQRCKSSGKDSAPLQANQKMTYTLRSAKGAASFVPVNYRAATSGTITEHRMTLEPNYCQLTNAKSTQWVTRETDSIKKQVEDKMKKIVNISVPGSFKDDSAGSAPGSFSAHDTAHASQGSNSRSGADSCAMEVDTQVPESSVNSRPMAPSVIPSNIPLQDTKDKLILRKASTTIPTPTREQSKRKANKSKDKSSESSPSPKDLAELLEPEVPMKDVAKKLLKEVKLKFSAMFPNRDIEREVCYDLHKLIKQSSCSLDGEKKTQNNGTPITFTDTILSTPAQWTDSKSNQQWALTDCKPTQQDRGSKKSKQASVSIGQPKNTSERTPNLGNRVNYQDADDQLQDVDWNISAQFSNSRNSFAKALETTEEDGKERSSIFCTDNLDLEDSSTPEPAMRINIDGSDDDDDDIDGLSGLNNARYDCFISDTLKQHAQHQQEPRSIGHSRGEHSSLCKVKSVPFNYQSGFSHVASRELPLTQCAETFSSYLHSSDSSPGNSENTHYHCFYPNKSERLFSTKCLITDTSVPTYQLAERHNSLGHQKPVSGGGDITFVCCKGRGHKKIPRAKDNKDCYGDNNDNGIRTEIFMRKPSSKSATHLMQSRHNLQTALDSACKDSSNSIRFLPDGFSARERASSSNVGELKNLLSRASHCGSQQRYYERRTSHNAQQPLLEMQGHQADMQQQARDFLDDLDRISPTNALSILRNPSSFQASRERHNILSKTKNLALQTGSLHLQL